MPTYQYTCTECGEPLEAVQSFSDAPLTECPNCGGKLRKVFNSVGIVFKGSGFYRNDSRAGNVSADKPATTTETKSEPKKSDTTPSTPSSTSSTSSSSTSTSTTSSSTAKAAASS